MQGGLMSGDSSDLVDLDGQRGTGPLWGIGSEDLNATLLGWGPGGGVGEHVNAERDVLIVVTEGSGLVMIDGREHSLRAQHVLLIRKGARRRITAGGQGMRYLSVHLRRGPLQIDPAVATVGPLA